MKTIIKIKALVLLMLFSTIVLSTDIKEHINQCADCHGKNGLSSEKDIPIIAGQSEILIEDALLAFAANERPCEKSEFRHGDLTRKATTMCEIASTLSEGEITELSMHYSGLVFVGVKQDYKKELIERGATLHDRHCEKCHSDGGTLADDDAGLLAGQWTPYLRTSVEKFLAGQRPMADKMAKKLKRLKAEDLEALFSFYAKNSTIEK